MFPRGTVTAPETRHSAAAAAPAGAASSVAGGSIPAAGEAADPILCQHCGRTASNGISCEGMCVADSGY